MGRAVGTAAMSMLRRGPSMLRPTLRRLPPVLSSASKESARVRRVLCLTLVLQAHTCNALASWFARRESGSFASAGRATRNNVFWRVAEYAHHNTPLTTPLTTLLRTPAVRQLRTIPSRPVPYYRAPRHRCLHVVVARLVPAAAHRDVLRLQFVSVELCAHCQSSISARETTCRCLIAVDQVYRPCTTVHKVA
jgi:hypothetical protein